MQCSQCGSLLETKTQFCPVCGKNQSPSEDKLVSKSFAVAPNPVSAVPGHRQKSNLPQPGDTFGGRYRIEKYLGLGSLCNAFLCRDIQAGNREVVLKILHARKAAESGMVENFHFLAESVAKYDHPGIAKIFHTGSYDGFAFYAMEWVSGIPLRLWLMERLNFENRVLPGLGMIRALLEIFEVIHERGCYGCLKPENVFVTLNGPVVMDFGVVGFLIPQEFEFNSYARRYLPYMAPELRQDWSNLLPHSDYYSLGALLYEILVGRAPAAQLRLPSELSPLFGLESDEVILKSMASKPMDRFGTLHSFKLAVESLQNTLLNARPPEGMVGLPPAIPIQTNRTHLDVTNDAQSVLNPEASFSIPVVTPTRPITPPETHQAPPPTYRPQVASDFSYEDEELDSGTRTVFMPRLVPEDDGRVLSNHPALPDRSAEEAHANRRFNTPPTPLPEPAFESLRSDSYSGRELFPEEGWDSNTPRKALEDWEVDADPVPLWLWTLIAFGGIGLVAVSAYFGLVIKQ